MENYKKLLHKRIIIMGVFIVFVAMLQISRQIGLLDYISNSQFGKVAIMEFQNGLMVGLELLFVLMIFRYQGALKDDAKLKKLYNYENDERRKLIKEKCGGNVIIISSLIIIFFGIISGYFNEIIFFSLIGCAIFQLVFCFGLKLYYLKKY